jgi:hypothetical protein
MELKICRGALGISHLLFVNNTLVFFLKAEEFENCLLDTCAQSTMPP